MKIIGQEIAKYYGEHQILYHCNFEINLNQPGVTGLIGPNGAGKSTLMRMLGGITEPNAGKLLIENKSILKAYNYSTWAQRNSYYVPTGERGLRNKLSTKDNLKYFAALRGKSVPKYLELLYGTAIDFDAEYLIDKEFDQMSTGQKKKSELMVAVALGARLLLLDEPSNGLDIDSQANLMQLIQNISNDNNKKVVISSHDPSLLASVVSQYIFIADGHILKTLNKSLDELELRQIYQRLYDRGA